MDEEIERVLQESGNTVTTATPCDVRWQNDILEQRWWIVEKQKGAAVKEYSEWRVVPEFRE